MEETCSPPSSGTGAQVEEEEENKEEEEEEEEKEEEEEEGVAGGLGWPGIGVVPLSLSVVQYQNE